MEIIWERSYDAWLVRAPGNRVGDRCLVHIGAVKGHGHIRNSKPRLLAATAHIMAFARHKSVREIMILT